MRRSLLIALLSLLAAMPAAAQFYSQGSEPAWVRWHQIKTPDYRVIYPEGLDSLARVYADLLERVKVPVGATAGYVPNQEYRKPLPVILHPNTASANGMVAWTPRRMELLTTPTFDPHDFTVWPEHLVAHESRHVAQMQYVNAKPYRPFRYIIGDLFAGAASSLYCGPSFDEGDAVAAETELSDGGRGRSAAFLEYYRAAFREGDMRNFWQWRYGSIRNYTPDYYTVGYIRAAGMRSVYGAQDFTARYYERIFRHKWWPWPLFNYEKTTREVTGKRFRDAFAEISDTLRVRWRRDELERGPFMPARQFTPTQRRFTEYEGTEFLGGQMYSIRSGIDRTRQLVRIEPGGSAVVLSQFAYSTSALNASESLGRLYWSEIVSDPRWELRSYSEIWYCGPDGAHRRLTHRTRWYNPSVSPDGLRISVTEYPVRGGSAVLVIDAQTGGVLARYDAPDGLQVIETVWLGDRVYASAISPAGSAIYDVTGGFAMVLDCGKSNVKDLDEFEGAIAFSSDITGVREFYAMHEGKVYRMTASAQGGDDFCFTPARDTLVYTGLTASGRHIYKTPVSALPEPVHADFGTAHAYELARDIQTPVPIDKDSVIVLPEPSRYNRFAHLLRVHSWAPVYVSTDAISELSFESITSSAGLGASVFFQNELETLVGSAAYGATFDDDGWHHTVETKFTYSGLYPKFEATLSLGSDPARQYFLQKWYSGFAGHEGLGARNLDGIPSFNASLLAYVPLNLSSGGWYRGIVPQLRFGLSNSYITYNPSSPMNRLTASVRGYVVSGTPSNGIYPRLGAGMEAGWSGRVGSTWLFAPNAYLFGYGYLPGILRSHGIKLTATLQAPLGSAMYTERYATVLPRGMDSYGDLASLLSSYPFQSRFTFDYAFPFLPLDWSALCPVAYVRNLECTLHADGSFFTAGGSDRMALASAGADLCVVLGNLAWVPYPTRIGVSGWWNWGAPEDKKPWNIGLVFNVDF